ncbi:MAG: hypothetical protein A2W03_02210 [Candidatus Aminicenantes bacterium RBG_16_63_16]|nr:MAG: hypothetical protein A2W03_02210 [Candidatus Aminicenantes bacterium RBG_16_63_16]
MRKRIAVFLILAAGGFLMLGAQTAQKTVSFKKLQEFLPKTDLSGFTRLKPGGETSSAMGMSTSEAHVTYEQGGDVSIEVKITDIAGVPLAQMGFSMIGMTEFENETENGYEKSIKVQGFAGTEKAEKTEDSKSCEVMLYVANRFTVELRGSGTNDASLLHKLLADMKLADLAKSTS